MSRKTRFGTVRTFRKRGVMPDRYTANAPMTNIIGRLAAKQKVSPTRFVRRAVLLMKYLADAQKAGHTVTVRDTSTGKVERLKF